MQIPLSVVVVPNWMVMRFMMPEGYSATMHGEYFTVSTSCYIVATAIIENGVVQFNFLPGERGDEFKRKLCVLFPEYNPDRAVYVVFYEWYGAYTFVGHGLGHDTAEDALSFVRQSHIDKNAILCLVHLSDLMADDGRSDDFVTLATYPINKEDGKLLPDIGPKRITITHLELHQE